MRIAMSAVVIMVGTRRVGSSTSGAMCSGFWSLACHCQAPAGLFTRSQS